MRLRELFEAPATAVMAFGRMNPPTIGHAKLVDAIKSQPGDPFIFLSQSQKPKTDPLAFQDKLRYAKFFFPNVTIGNPEVKTIIQALQKLESLGYKQLIYVAGSDRVQAFEEILNKYNGKDFTFKSIKVVSAGERDPDADGAEGMSASKMRQAAADNDLDSFKQGVPEPKLADEMFNAVRQGMGVNDTVPAESVQEGTDTVKDNLPDKIKVMKPQNPPKAPDATIPVSRSGYTAKDGTTYVQDKYDEDKVHVSNGGGTYTFVDSRMIMWKTPAIKGIQYIYDYVQRKIKLNFTTDVDPKMPGEGPTTVGTGRGDVNLGQSAMYDFKGNKIADSGTIDAGAGGFSVNKSKSGMTVRDAMFDPFNDVTIILKANPEKVKKYGAEKLKKDMDKYIAYTRQSQMGRPMPNMNHKARLKQLMAIADVKFLKNGQSIPARQAIAGAQEWWDSLDKTNQDQNARIAKQRAPQTATQDPGK